MMIEFWLAEISELFWTKAGGYTTDFEFAVTCAFPLSIERIGGLNIEMASDWLDQRGFKLNSHQATPNRPLRACLVALGDDRNFVLLDAADAIAEQKFSLAHEVAHFLLDYCQPRDEVYYKLGLPALEIIDGLRPASLEERVQGALANVSLRPYHHFMERNNTGDILNSTVLNSENRADRLALQLLAPEEIALPIVKNLIKGLLEYNLRWKITSSMLIEKFDLPEAIVRPYARQLVTEAGGDRTFMEWLNS